MRQRGAHVSYVYRARSVQSRRPCFVSLAAIQCQGHWPKSFGWVDAVEAQIAVISLQPGRPVGGVGVVRGDEERESSERQTVQDDGGHGEFQHGHLSFPVAVASSATAS